MRWLPYRAVGIKRSLILHNGVDTELFCKKAREGSSKNRFLLTIGCVGNFVKIKDQISLIKALIILRNEYKLDSRVVFVGSGPELMKCKKYVVKKKLSNYIDFLREVKHEELPDFYRSINLFVLPSYFEGFGCVYTEAWACGIPFIGCKGQGIDDLLSPIEQEKWLVPPQSPHDLAAAIYRYHKNRYPQLLSCEIDIKKLVAKFVSEVLDEE